MGNKDIKIGISTCPNDTFIFGAILNGYIETDYKFSVTMDDVEVLNNLVLAGSLDISKISFGVYNSIRDKYKILSVGGAMGDNVGPLLISKKYRTKDELIGKIIAIPGENTTANRILSTLYSDISFKKMAMRFDNIIPAVLNDEVDAGVIIHEGRFIYKEYNLNLIADMGNLWHDRFNLPLPLGCIVIKSELAHIADDINSLIRKSIIFARDIAGYKKIEKFIKDNAIDMEDDVIRAHINLYVNDFSLNLKLGEDAIYKLLGSEERVII